MSEILPCKKHGIKPIWREILPNDLSAMQNYPLGQKRRELYCPQCEAEYEITKAAPAVDAWNKANRQDDSGER